MNTHRRQRGGPVEIHNRHKDSCPLQVLVQFSVFSLKAAYVCYFKHYSVQFAVFILWIWSFRAKAISSNLDTMLLFWAGILVWCCFCLVMDCILFPPLHRKSVSSICHVSAVANLQKWANLVCHINNMRQHLPVTYHHQFSITSLFRWWSNPFHRSCFYMQLTNMVLMSPVSQVSPLIKLIVFFLLLTVIILHDFLWHLMCPLNQNDKKCSQISNCSHCSSLQSVSIVTEWMLACKVFWLANMLQVLPDVCILLLSNAAARWQMCSCWRWKKNIYFWLNCPF